MNEARSHQVGLLTALFVCSPVLLAACATDGIKPAEPVVVAQPVNMPVAAACVPENTPAAPAGYSDNPVALKAAADGPARLNLVLKANEERKGRLAVVEPVLAGCQKAGQGQ